MAGISWDLASRFTIRRSQPHTEQSLAPEFRCARMIETAITATRTKSDGSLRFCRLFPRTLRAGQTCFAVIRTSNAKKKMGYYDYYFQTG